MSNSILRNLNLPKGVVNVVWRDEVFSSLICQNCFLASRTGKTVALCCHFFYSAYGMVEAHQCLVSILRIYADTNIISLFFMCGNHVGDPFCGLVHRFNHSKNLQGPGVGC